MRTGRVTRVTDFGAFVELEPGIEGLAHVSTFEPTGRSQAGAALVAPGTTAAFEILTVDCEKKRIGLAPVPEGSARAAAVQDAHESDERPADAEPDTAVPAERFGSLADKLRGALTPRRK